MSWKDYETDEIISDDEFEEKFMTNLSSIVKDGYDKVFELTKEGIKLNNSELSDQDYHELCHQLHGSKSQFDEIDGECSVGSSLQEKKRYTVYSALYRGIYWGTMKALDDLDLEKMEVEEDQD